MSSADDRCAYKGCGLGRQAFQHREGSDYPDAHAFVEPDPQPEPSGDEAKTRDGDIVALMKELGPFNRGSVLAGLSRAYAAGKADGAREERGYWLRRARSLNAQYVTVEELEDDQRPGARRGSEGT